MITGRAGRAGLNQIKTRVIKKTQFIQHLAEMIESAFLLIMQT
jgi:hypothetical protein